MVDPLDDVDSLEEALDELPPLPPGIMPPSPTNAPPPPEFDLPPPDQPLPPQFGLNPQSASDGDLLDAASSLEDTLDPPPVESPSDFKSVWEMRKTTDPSVSSDSRDSIYNRINRISSGKGDSLMDRYADRFGSDLDREIIVLRKKDQDDLTSIKPKVELISAPSNTEMTLPEFLEAMDDDDFVSRVAEKTGVSAEKIDELDMDSMQKFFDKADTDNSGSLDFDEFVNGIIDSFRSYDEDFTHFFNVVNGLLGELPDSVANSFIESDDFELFKKIGADPGSTEGSVRGSFFTMVNELLVDLPETVMNRFTDSQDFELYKLIAERYGE